LIKARWNLNKIKAKNGTTFQWNPYLNSENREAYNQKQILTKTKKQ